MTRAPERRTHDALRVERGDWQTPPALARAVLRTLQRRGTRPDVIVEPTCGAGAFLIAAREVFPHARRAGFERSERHLATAREALGDRDPTALTLADFFEHDWDATLGALQGSILLLGNPPWVTSSTLGALGSDNLPPRENFKRLRGLEARTGSANFDLAEWMIRRLVEATRGRPFTLAMLCKSSVARRVREHAARAGWPLLGATFRVDAREHFGASVDAVLLTLQGPEEGAGARPWEVFPSLDAEAPEGALGSEGGTLYRDPEAWLRTRSLEGPSSLVWRSGLKHDCAPVMVLRRVGGALVNGLGETVDLEPECLHPLARGSDVAHGRAPSDRYLLVPQRFLGEDTERLRADAPRAWAYLQSHRARLDARKSSIYRGRPPFSVFGVGPYTFAPWKVAVCGLYKRLRFTALGPVEGRPVVLDDTTYFLPCEDRAQAEALTRALGSERAREFFHARVFWDAKRPVNRAVLGALSLDALLAELGHGPP